MGLLIKILFLSEYSDTAWNSNCSSTRNQWWVIFSGFLSVTIVSMVLPLFKADKQGRKDNNNYYINRLYLILTISY